ncbi:MAG TPA: L-threonylcarbamoyladenylate synthase [Planctomycetota bacterium]|nr:L-threonylcarbamoyladenylate synthase [Planctomycetota bacterium]
MEPPEIAQAVAILRRGGLVALPTETVYGLGADAANPDAVRRIFAAKGRPADHPVIVHLPEAAALARWADPVPPAAEALARAFWPGPLTLIVPRAAHVLDLVTGGQPSVGLRIPDHPVARALLHAFGGGVAAPSANRFGRLSPPRAEHVRAELGDAVDLVLEGGASRVGIESTIVDLTGAEPAILRPGAISARDLEAVLGAPVRVVERSETRAPGTLESHYAPRTPLRLVERSELTEVIRTSGSRRLGVLSRLPAPAYILPDRVRWRQAPADAAGFAHALYAALRDLDGLGLDEIVVEAPPMDEAWVPVRDRLRRAAHRET